MVDSDGDSMKATLQTVVATLSTLQTAVEEQFKEVREQFKHVDEQFKHVDEQFKDVHERIRAESEESRRHFEMLVEQMKAERNLVLDGSLANTAELRQLRQSHLADHTLFEQTLADHEERLTQLEKKD
jgi:hypothetical protein